MSRSREAWIRRNAFLVAVALVALCFAAKALFGTDVEDLLNPVCSSKKCPYETMGIYLEGECWCITKPDP